LVHPNQRKKIRVGISAVGVLGSDDGGEKWRFMNKNIRADFLPEKYPEHGQCVHKIDFNPSRPDALFLQNHGGVYLSRDFGEDWQEIGGSLPSDFGFPIGAHPHEQDKVYVVPVRGETRYPPNGEFQLWVSEDSGKSWFKSSRGLPRRSYFNVLREAMAMDGEEPCGIYVGCTNGQVFCSIDDDKSWQRMAENLPRIFSVSCVKT
jgi:phage pi2 protein 07